RQADAAAQRQHDPSAQPMIVKDRLPVRMPLRVDDHHRDVLECGDQENDRHLVAVVIVDVAGEREWNELKLSKLTFSTNLSINQAALYAQAYNIYNIHTIYV